MFLKRFSLLFFGLCLFAPIQAQEKNTLFTSKSPDQLKAYFSNHPADIYFDLHNVLVVRDTQSFIMGGIGNFGSTVQGFEKLYLAGEFARVLLRPAFYQGVWNLLHQPERGKHKVTEAYFDMIGGLGYKRLQKELIQFANNIFKINPKMVPLVAGLKAAGHNLHLFSNIGPKILTDAQKRKLFEPILKEFGTNVINDKTIEYWKPEQKAFETALKNTESEPHNAIMIDDKLSNLPVEEGIAVAQKKAENKKLVYQRPQVWAAGILYNKKNHESSIKAFKKIGLLPE